MSESQTGKNQTVQPDVIRVGYVDNLPQGTASCYGFRKLDLPYSEDNIRTIKDDRAGTCMDVPVSVPSPYAILDLPRMAFKNVATYIGDKISKNPNLSSAKVIASLEDFKTVSYVLDLAELMYYDSNNIELIDCSQDCINGLKNYRLDEQKDLEDKLNDQSDSGRTALIEKIRDIKDIQNLGKTLDAYKFTDHDFGFLNTKDGNKFNLTLVYYKKTKKVLGGFSKETLFFVTRNEEDLEGIYLHGRELFSDKSVKETFPPDLEKIRAGFEPRGEEFVQWLLNITDNQKTPIAYYMDKISDKKVLNKTANAGNSITINGKLVDENKIINIATILGSNDDKALLQSYVENIVESEDDYEREIIANKAKNGIILVKGLRYRIIDLNDGFVKVTEEEEKNETIKKDALKEAANDIYNEIKDTIEDYRRTGGSKKIFANYLIKIPYKPSGNFKTLKVKGDEENTYLYPIKSDYKVSDYEAIKGELVNNGVRVWEGEIDKYYFNTNNSDKIAAKDGIIVETDFALRIFPFARGSKEYRVMLIEDIVKRNKQPFKFDVFFPNEKEANNVFKTDEDPDMETSYLIIENFTENGDPDPNFEPAINLNAKYNEEEFEVHVPTNFNTLKNTKNKFSFAVDFGTTNTHIEYLLGSFVSGVPISINSIKPFSLENHVATLMDLDDVKYKNPDSILVSNITWNEFLPKDGIGGEDKFPFRTLLFRTGIEDRRDDDPLNSLGKFVIPFEYKSNSNYTDRGEIFADLKWEEANYWQQTSQGNENFKYFLREILFLLYAKVLIEGGHSSISDTEIFYSYPVSMNPNKQEEIHNVWEKQYKYFFNDTNVKLKKVEESFAPLKYFLQKGTFVGNSPFRVEKGKYTLCIDIGGGSTDSIVATRYDGTEDRYKYVNILFHTSFKFAGNDIFGGSLSNETEYHYNALTKAYIDYYTSQEILDDGQKKGKLYKKNRDKSYICKNGDIYGGNINKIAKREFFKGDISGEVNSYLFSLEKELGSENYMEKLKEDTRIKIALLYFFSAIIYNIIKMLKDNDEQTPVGQIPVVKDIVFSGNGSKILHILGTPEKLDVVVKNILEMVYDDGEGNGPKISKENLSELHVRFADNPKTLTAKGCLIPPKQKTGVWFPDSESEQEDLQKILYKGYETEQIEKEIYDFNDIFVKLLSKDNIEKSFKITKEQKEKLESLCKPGVYPMVLDEFDDTLQGSFVPLKYFILSLFKEFVTCVPQQQQQTKSSGSVR